MPSSRKRLLSVLFDSGASFEQENAYRRWPVSFWTRRRIASACRDKGTTWSQPVFILAAGIVQRSASQPIDLAPLHFIDHAGAGNGQRIEAQGKANKVTEPRSRPRCADELEDARHVTWFGDAGTRRRNVGNHLPIQVAEWIVAVAFDIGIVADLLTDTAHAVAGFELSLGFV